MKIAKGWINANAYLHDIRSEALTSLHQERYPGLPMKALEAMLDADLFRRTQSVASVAMLTPT